MGGRGSIRKLNIMTSKIVCIIFLLIGLKNSIGQNKYVTKSGELSFEASVPSFEKVAADNKSVTAILNTANGEFAALALVRAFRFKNALMEEHFNENYAETDRFPKATFKGKIAEYDSKTFGKSKDPLFIDGELTFHGITKRIEHIPLIVKTNNQKISISGNFKVLVSDFNIKIPKIVKNKLSNEVTITFNYELIKK